MKKNMLLIHGWDYELYNNMTDSNDAWNNYHNLIKRLGENYNLYKVNLPGFCKENEPSDKEWNVSDFANYIDKYIKKNNINPDIVLGYSFGGAVAIKWKVLTNNKAKLFLIAPAIIRNNSNSKKFINTPKFLDKIRTYLRDLYVIYIIKNNEMKYGSKFLRNTYQKIVREDLINDVYKIDPKDISIIIGNKDLAVAPQELLNNINQEYKDSIKIINDANHDNIIEEDKYIDNINNTLIKKI